MSRKCPKRNHVFLNWLKANRSRFTFQPSLVKCWKKRIYFELMEITPALRFFFYSCYGFSRIYIEVVWKGMEWDSLGDFYVCEERTDRGWMCRSDPPETRQYWQTREEMLIEHCFEPFLESCNRELATARWLELYELSEMSGAQLYKDHPGANTMLEKLKKGFELDGIIPPRGQKFIVSFCKHKEDQEIAPSAYYGNELMPLQFEPSMHHRLPFIR